MSQRSCNSESFRKPDLIGKADAVEFHRMDDGTWIPFSVEYKRGKPKWIINNEWWFSIIDVCWALTESADAGA